VETRLVKKEEKMKQPELGEIRACLVCVHKQPYQNWLANFLAQDLAAHGLPKFWQESVKEM
jgi:hypothetical protein